MTFTETVDLQVALRVRVSRRTDAEEAESIADLEPVRPAQRSRGDAEHCGIYFLNAELFRRQTGLDIFL